MTTHIDCCFFGGTLNGMTKAVNPDGIGKWVVFKPLQFRSTFATLFGLPDEGPDPDEVYMQVGETSFVYAGTPSEVQAEEPDLPRLDKP